MLTGKRIVVVGGTGNVGRHLVRALLETGADVVVPSRSDDRIAALREEMGPETVGRLSTMRGDLEEAGRTLASRGRVDGVVASLGRFVPAPHVLRTDRAVLDGVLSDYVGAHWTAAHTLVPALAAHGGGYVMINGPLAFTSSAPGAGLVSVATAAQSMLARVLMHEYRESAVRINEVVIYSGFGWGRDDENEVSGADIGSYVAWLLAHDGVRGRTIHLDSQDALRRGRRARRLHAAGAAPSGRSR